MDLRMSLRLMRLVTARSLLYPGDLTTLDVYASHVSVRLL